MDYGMIGKIEKAKRYSQQRDRIHFEAFKVTFEGQTTLTQFNLKRASGNATATSSTRAVAAATPWPSR